MKNNSMFVLAALVTLWSCGSEQKNPNIGGQTWSSTNLNVDRFRNGDLIAEAKTADEWKQASDNKTPAWCYFLNDSSNSEKYGRLYNLYAVIDPRGLAPAGWRIPSAEDWKALNIEIMNEYCGDDVERANKDNLDPYSIVLCDDASAALKATDGWEEGDVPEGNNSSGLAIRPWGGRSVHGDFFPGGDIRNTGICAWWSSTTTGYEGPTGSEGVSLGFDFTLREDKEIGGVGLAVRCKKD
jgi:uncharacterized protein (TIGR02145 family)